MSFWIAGLGTALPEHSMSQSQATELAQQICCENEEQARLLAVLYRKAGVNNRFTALPHRIALDWLEQGTSVLANGAAASVAGNQAAGNGVAASAVAEIGAVAEAVAGHGVVENGPSGNGGLSGNGALHGNGHILAVAETRPATLGPTTAERMQFYEEHAWPLAERASRQALTEAGIEPGAITHLITVSCTGFVAPGVDVALINRLGLPLTTERVNVGFMGCHGALNGLRVARAIAAADPDARILLCAVELCSLHYRFQWDPERFIGNALFADGAAALVGGGTIEHRPAGNGSAGNELDLDGSAPGTGPWQVAATGSCLLPDSTDAMTWRVGDHGFEMTLSPRVPDLISQHLRPWLTAWLAKNGTSIEEIGTWAVHPGGPRILSAVEQSLGLPRSATGISRDVLAEHGNMSSPTVLFIFDRLRQAAAVRPCVMLGFGPGLMAEAALLR